jgi:hypothetical protein
VSETFDLVEKILNLHVKETSRKYLTAENQNAFVLKKTVELQ